MASDEDILKFYDLDCQESYSSTLGKFGKVNKLSGEFEFQNCEDCKGPVYAHKKCLGKEKTLHWSQDQYNLILLVFKDNCFFKAALAKLDNWISVSTCDQCEKRFGNRTMLENHMQIVHKIQLGNQFHEETKSSMISQVQNRQNYPKNQPQMLTKTPEIPAWVKSMKFEYFKSQVEAWNKDNLKSDKKKFDRLVESFKKNSEIKDLKSFATTIILSKLRDYEKQNVNEILKLMENRFG